VVPGHREGKKGEPTRVAFLSDGVKAWRRNSQGTTKRKRRGGGGTGRIHLRFHGDDLFFTSVKN